MRILTVVCAAVLCGCAAKSPFAIRIAPDAQPATRRAAAELQHYVREATGRTLAITNDLNGRGFAYLPTNADYGPDGYRIVSDGERLEIRANGIHGHLFGTYGFLKRFLGVQWFLASYTNIPHRAAFDLPAGLDWTDVPAFELRDLCEPTTTRDLDFALHLRLHGRHFRVPYPESVGGESFTMDKVLQNSHTFQRILPPSKHFREHPEWYSEVDGKRREVGGQLCLSNPEVLRRTIDFVLDRMRQNPKVKYFGVSQNDVRNYCTCAKCRAVDEEEGAHSGSIIRFVNKVAEAVEKVDPEVTITTLAYQYSVEPPKHVRPRRNVMIVLCDIGCDFSKPFGTSRAKPNVEFTRILEGWKALGARIYMWDYTTNYPYYQELFHNVDTLGPNLRFFRDHGVRQVYEEGANFAPHADSSELKTWMLSELMWNPDQDTDALRDAFIDGVYGKGAPFVKDYYRLRRELARTRDEVAHPMTCFEDIVNGPATLAFFERAEALWMKALEAAKGDAVAERQCRLGLFSTDAAHAILATRTPSGANFVVTRHPETLGGPEILRAQEAAKRVLGFLKAEPRQRLAHGSSPVDDIVLRRQVQLFAERKFDVSGAGSFEAGPRSMKVDSVAEYYKHVPDAEALDGEIVEMNPEYSMQGIKFFFKNAFVEPGCGVRCRLRMRIRKLKGGDPEQVIAFGAIDAPGCTDGRVTRSFRIRAKDVGTDGWAWYDIGTVPMVDSRSRVWLGIAGTHEKPVAGYIALDRLEVSLAD